MNRPLDHCHHYKYIACYRFVIFCSPYIWQKFSKYIFAPQIAQLVTIFIRRQTKQKKKKNVMTMKRRHATHGQARPLCEITDNNETQQKKKNIKQREKKCTNKKCDNKPLGNSRTSKNNRRTAHVAQKWIFHQ